MRRFLKVLTLDYVVWLGLLVLVTYVLLEVPTKTVAERLVLSFGAFAVMAGLASLLLTTSAEKSADKTQQILGDIADKLDRQLNLLQEIADELGRPKETPTATPLHALPLADDALDALEK
jgi:hypothetical protein